MSEFEALMVGHLVGDFLFQTSRMAEGKNKNIVTLIVHSAVYTLCIFLFSSTVGLLSWWVYLVIFGTHVMIDTRLPSSWWMRTVMRTSASKNGSNWLSVVVDQILHVLVIYFLVLWAL